MRSRHSILVLLSIAIGACQQNIKKNNSAQFLADSLVVNNYIRIGDSIYAQKNSYNAFSKSLELYDSAWQVAEKAKDTNLLAISIFAKGRAYEPLITIHKKPLIIILKQPSCIQCCQTTKLKHYT